MLSVEEFFHTKSYQAPNHRMMMIWLAFGLTKLFGSRLSEVECGYIC